MDIMCPSNFENGWLVGCRVKANCTLLGPKSAGIVPSVGVFLRDPSPYLREFGENHGKL